MKREGVSKGVPVCACACYVWSERMGGCVCLGAVKQCRLPRWSTAATLLGCYCFALPVRTCCCRGLVLCRGVVLVPVGAAELQRSSSSRIAWWEHQVARQHTRQAGHSVRRPGLSLRRNGRFVQTAVCVVMSSETTRLHSRVARLTRLSIQVPFTKLGCNLPGPPSMFESYLLNVRFKHACALTEKARSR